MSELNPLSSAQWHRVCDLTPRLSPQVDVARVWLRGQRWYVLHHREHGQRCRLNQQAYDIAARMDGKLSVHELWSRLDRTAHDHPGHLNHEPPSQDEMVQVLALLIKHHLLSFEEAPDFGTILSSSSGPNVDQADTGADSADQGAKPPNTPWNWRLPLGSPQHWLQRHHHWAHVLFSPWGLMLWSLSMAALLAGWVMNAEALQEHARTWMATPGHVLQSLLLYPLIKAVHEAAHALALTRWGGQVRECGITLMMLMPVPYVDASAAHGFSLRHQRVIVSAAGIMAELALATLGLGLWVWTEPGWWHNIGFVIWFIACTSTLLFNGNPLQRLDGYHVLTDALQLPNLAIRSRHWWQQRVLHWLVGQAAEQNRTDTAPQAPGEGPWLRVYAPLSWLYQVGLWGGLSIWAGTVSAPLGWALGALSACLLLIMPLRAWGGLLWRAAVNAAPRQSGLKASPIRRLAALIILPVLLMILPVPDRTVAQGVVWAPDQAMIRPEVDGFVAEILRGNGAQVKAGDVVLRLQNPQLLARRDRVAAELSRAQQSQFGFMGMDAAKAGQAAEDITRWQSQLDRVDEQLAALQVRARSHGRIVWPEDQDMQGRYLKRGSLIGHVMAPGPATIRLAVDQDDLPKLRNGHSQVSVRLSDPRSTAQTALLVRDSMGATRKLHSAALSEAMGGTIATDPKDEHHLQTLRPVILMDVRMNASGPQAQLTRLGERAWVRLDHGWAPPVWQLAQVVRRQVLKTFNPQQ